MESFTTQDLIEELQQFHPPIPDRREGGITRDEWAEAQNISYEEAKKQLEGLVSDGVLVCEYSRLGLKSMGYVYYKI